MKPKSTSGFTKAKQIVANLPLCHQNYLFYVFLPSNPSPRQIQNLEKKDTK